VKQAKKHTITFLVVCVVLIVLALAACAPRQAAQESAGGPASESDSSAIVQLTGWTPDSDCESCHVVETESGATTGCTYSLHTTVACTTCHTDDEGALTLGHEKYAEAKQPTKLKKSKVSPDACKSCHDTEEVKTITASLTVLTDSSGTVVNPHDLPDVSEHNKNIDCSNCHKMHKPEPIAETAKAVCIRCHHQDVFECGTCHD
jgi:predicted CXXCH cytochrome family protein